MVNDTVVVVVVVVVGFDERERKHLLALRPDFSSSFKNGTLFYYPR